MDSGTCGNRELKVALHAFQIRGMAYELLPTQGIRYRVDTATEFALLIFVDDFFSSVHSCL